MICKNILDKNEPNCKRFEIKRFNSYSMYCNYCQQSKKNSNKRKHRCISNNPSRTSIEDSSKLSSLSKKQLQEKIVKKSKLIKSLKQKGIKRK